MKVPRVVNFHDGSAIASIADMRNLVFEGQLDESEIGKVRPGMELIISVARARSNSLEGNKTFVEVGTGGNTCR